MERPKPVKKQPRGHAILRDLLQGGGGGSDFNFVILEIIDIKINR